MLPMYYTCGIYCSGYVISFDVIVIWCDDVAMAIHLDATMDNDIAMCT